MAGDLLTIDYRVSELRRDKGRELSVAGPKSKSPSLVSAMGWDETVIAKL
jgi:hypothetical protein